jgi:muramoyltetrapeptide carboxypeptidase
MIATSSARFFPKPLKLKGTIGIVSPGCWAEPAWIETAKDRLEEAGYRVEIHAQNYLKKGSLAGSDEARAEALIDMFADQTIDAVLCARGGTGCLQLLDKIDYKLISKCPKPFIGFSDVTVLLQAIAKNCGFVTFHGPMVWNLGREGDKSSLPDLLSVMAESEEKRFQKRFSEVEVARSGKAEGSLWGGNLTLLQNLVGTPFDFPAKDSVLFIEETAEAPYRIARMLEHFKLAGKLKPIRAVIVGEMTELQEDSLSMGADLRDIVLDAFPAEVPMCFDFPCGHGDYLTTLPVGAHVHVSMSAQGVDLSFIR